MHIQGKQYRTIWFAGPELRIIDQRKLPFEFVVEKIRTVEEMVTAIRDMHLRGAPLIGVAAAAGAYLAALELTRKFKTVNSESLKLFEELLNKIKSTRPTAVNLAWALEQQRSLVELEMSWSEVADRLMRQTCALADEDVRVSESIGRHGLGLLEQISSKKGGKPVNILTHCNAGWLATIDYGTATAPIYLAHKAGIPVHVWVDETRPRLQGSRITAYELGEEGIPHTIICDNTGGHLMQRGEVDLCIVGTDRTTRTGDVANKIGTYLKALAAKHNNIPFYVAAPSSSIDWSMRSGLEEIRIEERDELEVLSVEGALEESICSVRIAPTISPAKNYGFDVTPAELVTGLITERGVCEASEAGLFSLFPPTDERELI